MGGYIYQGGEEISEESLSSHITSLCQLENIGVLLGAGSSVGCGGKTMKDIWLDFKLNNEHLIPFLCDECKLLKDEEINSDSVNIEILIDKVSQFLSVENTRAPNSETKTNLQACLQSLYQSVTKAALLVEKESFGKPNIGALNKFDKHRELLEKLLSNRQPGQSAPMLFTTNYDLSLEWAAEEVGIQLINGFFGVHTRSFQPQNFDLSFRNVNAKGEARFGHYHAYLLKLHGSLTWIQKKDHETHEVSSALAYQRYIEPILNKIEPQEEQYLIYPGANKYHHTIGYVYGEMFRRFSEFLSQPQSALFINGYGFGNYHINRIILGALLNPSLHIVIFYPELNAIDQEVGKLSEAQKCIKKLKSLALNQITIVGGNDKAYFNSFVDLIPKPVLFPRDNTVKDLIEAINELSGTGSKQ